jgi:hypothetical protein
VLLARVSSKDAETVVSALSRPARKFAKNSYSAQIQAAVTDGFDRRGQCAW